MSKFSSVPESECLTTATLALTAANTDEQLQACIGDWLPSIVQCLASSSDTLRSQIFELLAHVNRRLKSRPNVKLPLPALRVIFKSSDNTFIQNFGMVYLKMGFARLSPEEQIDEFYDFLECVSHKGAAQRDSVFQSLLRTFAPSHNDRSRIERFEASLQKSPRFRILRLVDNDFVNASAFCVDQETKDSKEKPFENRSEVIAYARLIDGLLDFLLDFLLVPYTVPSKTGIATDQLAPACLSVTAYRRVLPGDIDWTPELLERTKSGIVQFLAICSLFNDSVAISPTASNSTDRFEKLSANRIAPHFLLAEADSRHHVVMAASHDLRRITAAVDWTATSLHSRLFSFYLGDADSARLIQEHRRAQAARISLPAVTNSAVVTQSGPASQLRNQSTQNPNPIPKTQADLIRMPANTRIRLKLLPAFMKSPAFARSVTLLRVVFDTFYNEDCSNAKLKCIAVRVLRFLIEHATQELLTSIGPAIRKELELRIRPVSTASNQNQNQNRSTNTTAADSQPVQDAESVLRFLRSTLQNAQGINPTPSSTSTDASTQAQSQQSTQSEVARLELIKLRQLAYETLGRLFSRLPNLLVEDSRLEQVRSLFYTLRDAPGNDDGLRSAVQQCLLHILEALTKLKATKLQSSQLNALEAILFENADGDGEEPDTTRALLVSQFASRLFSRSHVPSKYILIICSSHSRDAIRNEALRALAYPAVSETLSQSQTQTQSEEGVEMEEAAESTVEKDLLPEFGEFVEFALDRCETQRPIPVTLLRYAVTFARTCFLQRCIDRCNDARDQSDPLGKLSEYVAVRFPVEVEDLMSVASRSNATMIHRYVTSLTSSNQNQADLQAFKRYLKLLEQAVLRMCSYQSRSGATQFDASIVYCLLEAVACGTSVATSLDKSITFEWAYSTLACSSHAAVRELAGELCSLLLNEAEFGGEMESLLARLFSASFGSDHSSLERSHGSLLLAGHLIHRSLRTQRQNASIQGYVKVLSAEALKTVSEVKAALQKAGESEQIDADSTSLRAELHRELETVSVATLSASQSLRFHATLSALGEIARSARLGCCLDEAVGEESVAQLIEVLVDFACWRKAPTRFGELTMRTLAHVAISHELPVDRFESVAERLIDSWCKQRGRSVDTVFVLATHLVAMALGRSAFDRLNKWSQSASTAFSYDHFAASLRLVAADESTFGSTVEQALATLSFLSTQRIDALLAMLGKKLASDDTHTRLIAASLLFVTLKRCSQMQIVGERRDMCHAVLINALLKESGRTSQIEADESTSDLLSKSLFIIHNNTSASGEEVEELRSLLIETLTSGRRLNVDFELASVSPEAEKKRKVTFADANAPLSIDTLGTYRELCALATALNRTDLVVSFLSIAHHQNVIWSVPRVAELASRVELAKFSSLRLRDDSNLNRSENAFDLVSDTFDKLVAKLYRARFDPSARTARSMQRIWRAVVHEAGRAAERRLVDRLFDSLLNELLVALSGASWRIRESACAAFSELTRGRAQLLQTFGSDRLVAFWSAAFALLDDAKESVRRAADDGLVRVLRRVTLAAFDSSDSTSSPTSAETNELLEKLLPLLLEKGLVSKVDEIRGLSIAMLTELVRIAGESMKPHFATFLPSLLEYLAVGESSVFNYLALHVAGQTGLHGTASDGAGTKLDAARISALKSSPLLRIINDAVSLLQLERDAQVLRDLVRRFADLLSAGSTATRCGCSETLTHLIILLLHQPAAREQPESLQSVFSASMPKLIGAAVHVLAHEQSRIVRQQIARTFGYLARFAKPSVLEQAVHKMRGTFLEKLATLADGESDGKEQTAQFESDTGCYAEAFLSVARHSPEAFLSSAFQAAIVPFVFVAMAAHSQSNNSQQKKSATMEIDTEESAWVDVLQESAAGNTGALIEKHCDAILALIESSCFEASSYCVKARGASALHRLISRLFSANSAQSADRRDLFTKLLRLVLAQLSGRTWPGKHVLLECLAALINVALRFGFHDSEEFKKCYAILLLSCKKENVAFKRAALLQTASVVARVYGSSADCETVLRSNTFGSFLSAYYDIMVSACSVSDEEDEADRKAREELRVALLVPLALAFPPSRVHQLVDWSNSSRSFTELWNEILALCIGCSKHGVAWRQRVEAFNSLHLLFDNTRFDITGLQQLECSCPSEVEAEDQKKDEMDADAVARKCEYCEAAKRLLNLLEIMNNALRDSHSNVRDAALNATNSVVVGWILEDEGRLVKFLRLKHSEQVRSVLYSIARLLTNEQIAAARSFTNTTLCDKLLVSVKSCLTKFESA